MARSRAAIGVIAALAVLLVAGLLLWGAGSGEPLVGEPSLRLPEGPTLPDDKAATAESLPPQENGQTNSDDGAGGLNVALILQFAAAALMAWLVLRWFRNREADGPTEFVSAEPIDELDVLVQATAASGGVEAARDGEPRNSVVACWVALEDALARSGAAPQTGETSLDLTQRVLRRWHVDPAALNRLGDLFREARFSRHAITRAHADDAVEALSQIHEGLARAAADRDSAAATVSGASTNEAGRS